MGDTFRSTISDTIHTNVHDVATTCSHHSVFMRITINNGIDSSSSVINNNNNVVLDAAPASMVQLEAVNKIVADGSTVTPAIMSEIASVDLNVEPSMVETSSHSTKGFFSEMAHFVSSKLKSSSGSLSEDDLNFYDNQSDATVIDFGGSHIVYAFGKLYDNDYLLRDLNVDYNEMGIKNTGDKYRTSAKRIVDGITLFKYCYESYSDDEKQAFSHNPDEYLSIRKAMKNNEACLINSGDIPFSKEDVDYVANQISLRYYPELEFASFEQNFKLTPSFSIKVYRQLDSMLTGTWKRAANAYGRISRHEKLKESDYDDAVGMKLMYIFDKLLFVAIIEMYMKCPNTVDPFLIDMVSLSGDQDALQSFVRNTYLDSVAPKQPHCYIDFWKPKERLAYVGNVWKINDELKNLYQKLPDSDAAARQMDPKQFTKWTKSITRLEQELKDKQDIFLSRRLMDSESESGRI